MSQNGKQDRSFTTAFTVNRTLEEVFDAVSDVRSWWSGEIDGPTRAPGDVFTYRYKNLHLSRQEVVEAVRGKRVVWRVLEGRLEFVKKKEEWTGTECVFDITRKGAATELRFTHRGLLPDCDCFEACEKGWTFYIQGSLRELLTQGKGASQLRESGPAHR